VSRSFALDKQIIRVGRNDVEITRPAKVLFPADQITKGDLIDDYRRIAPWMLPHMRDRPLAVECYPDGIDGPSFFHKAVPSYFPDWIKRVTVKKAGGTITDVVCNNEATLAYIANQACITPLIWLSRID
jgi:bifunctional non-homologous end joining protein LigD